ncbi:peptidase, M13 family protein [Arcticibacter svalbardensis MN12-7]|uniref:Peptidase, M13 family protein n=1 Tax=Arcticibacter svalbardensis MN12-7 TaxID=1150600 RepID=R9GPG5_9SPHI|nr:M13 family metallopeptidase [Arcticibacter svalbardensis]EOR93603.1 peptidase, M13 family protein [Arcticibacter svalbardensis MN12-7]
MRIKNISYVSMATLLVGLTACNKGTQSGSEKFIETASLDSSINPGDNFFQYVNGKWIGTAKIPSTQTSTGTFDELYNKTKENIKSLLEESAASEAVKGTLEQKVGDFYASGMDSAAIEKLGYTPIKPYLDKINAIKTPQQVLQFEAEMEKQQSAIFTGLYVGPDEKNSSTNILALYQTGLGLPDRDYYFKTDAETKAIQKAYKECITKLFVLIGDNQSTATKKSEAVYAFEKQLAESHRTNVELRDPQKNYNKSAVSDLDKTMPVLKPSAYLALIGVKTDSVNIGQPAYYAKVNDLLKSTPLDIWKAYLAAHIIRNASMALSTPFENADFEYTKVLSGQKQIKPRWERIYRSADANLGELLGQLYVKKHFSEDAKSRMMELIDNLQKAFDSRISKVDWMTDSTKKVAKEKLHTFIKKIGYPEKWKDYSKVSIDRSRYFENIVACDKVEFAYQINKVGKPVDKTEWGMTPPTINAYYNPTINEIVFPAGILQFPFFDLNADDAINYGAIGMVIGHEMTHGFDDQGSQYDKTGNLKNWWAVSDNVKFKAKSKQVIDLYSSFTAIDTLHINGALTTGENMADIGGIAIAYDAFKLTKQGQDTIKIDGLTPDQRFFISFARVWKEKREDKSLRLQVSTDPHSPAQYRVNVPLMNFTPFYNAFNVKEGEKMFLPVDKRIKIW